MLPPELRLPFCLFVVLLWLRRILGKAFKCLNKIKFLKSELKQSEPKDVEGHRKASPKFWGDELRWASYRRFGMRHGCQARQTSARAKEMFVALLLPARRGWGSRRGLLLSHLFFITLCSSNTNTKVCGHCCGQSTPDAESIPPRLYKLQQLNILETVF